MTSPSTTAQARSPEIGKSVIAGPVQTNYLEAGVGAPVILIHGSGPGVSPDGNSMANTMAPAETCDPVRTTVNLRNLT